MVFRYDDVMVYVTDHSIHLHSLHSRSNKKRSAAGFTIIELLVVIAIIGLLASIVLASLNSARVKGRDASRQIGVEQINNAVQLYMADNGGNAPTLQGSCNGLVPGTGPADCIATSYDNSNGRWSLFMADLAPYMSAVPSTCTSSCAGLPAFGFVYVAPTAMYYYCQQIYCPEYTSGRLNFAAQYQLYSNLENNTQKGTKTDGEYFYNPTGMYLRLVASRNGVPVDASYVGTCIVSLTANPITGGGAGTGPCFGVRQVNQPATYNAAWFSGCLQNDNGTIPPSCSWSAPSVLVNTPGVTTMNINVTQ